MAPVKFDDLPKVSSEVLNDDHQISGFQFKAKQKTSLEGSVITTAVDLWAKDGKTPAKMTWKIPKVYTIAGLCIDKLEMDKAGKYKLEASLDKALHKVNGLKVEVKSDLNDKAKATVGFHYSGAPVKALQDTQFKFETKALKPQEFTTEFTKTYQMATFGAKCGMKNLAKPDLGIRLLKGNMFGAFMLKDSFSVFSLYGFYKVNPDILVACSFDKKPKGNNFSFGAKYTLNKGTSIKAKVQEDTSISCTIKHEVSKGFTVMAGGKYNTTKKDMSYGVQLSIE